MFKYLAFLHNDLRECLPALDTGIYSGQFTRFMVILKPVKMNVP